MDDLLREFLTETGESLDVIDVELVRFEQDPGDARILGNIFRLVHTIKGTCGFLGLPRLEAIAHAAETLMGKFRDGAAVTADAVSLVLASIDRIKEIIAELEARQAEPPGADSDIIAGLERMALSAEIPASGGAREEAPATVGTLVYQVLERKLRPGEVSLDELERAFRETAGPPAASGPPVERRRGERRAGPRLVEEDEADRAREGDPKQPVAAQSIRVPVETLEHLMTMVSELVLTRNQLLEIVRRHEESEFKVPLQRLANVTAELQEGIMKTRMQPIGNAWQKLPRIVRDLAHELGKEIELEMVGAETELDRQVLELVKDPLTHMVRNSADHGIETPAERKRAGKPEKGTIRLSAYHQGGHIVIDIADDGRGLDFDRIAAKVVERGLASEAELAGMSEAQIAKFVFAPGFSTAAKVTSVSGRGVGMDVVKTNIDAIGGAIDLRSGPGRGTTVTIKIPLTLAIVSTLIVEAGGDRFAIPQLAVVELVRAQAKGEHRIERIRDAPVLRLRDKLLPLVRLTAVLGMETGGEGAEQADDGYVVVMQAGNRLFGVVVDGVSQTEEIVVKPMAAMLRHLVMFSGNTILGDGSVIMIIDPNGIAQAMGSRVGDGDDIVDQGKRCEAAAEEDAPVALLLFRAGSPEPKAVPLSLVTRLEEFEPGRIERSNGRDLVQYRGALMPLVYVDETEQRRGERARSLLVFSDGGRAMGLVVDEIIDIVEERLVIEMGSQRPGLLGSAIVRGRATEVVDVGHYLPLAFDDWLKRKDGGQPVGAVRTLLFVDDAAFFRNLLTPVLKSAGFRVTVCESGDEALAQLEAGRAFDVIVSDIEMPEMSGFELAERVRRSPRFRSIPIVALSALCTPSAVERGRQAGFDDFVAKFDRPGLLAALKELTSGYEMELAA